MPFLAAIPAVVGSVASAIGSAAGAAAGAVGSAVGSAAGAASSALGSAAGSVGSAIGSAAGSAGSAIGQAAGATGQALGQVPQALGQAGQAVGQAGQAVGKGVLQAGQAAGKAVTKPLTTGLQKALPSAGRGELLQGLSKADLAAMASKGITLTGEGGQISPATLGKIAQAPTTGGQALQMGKKLLKSGLQMTQKGGEEQQAQQAQQTPIAQGDALQLLAQLIATGQMPQLQAGGTVPAGQPAIVGEAGPEVAMGGPEGLAVQPFQVAPVTPEGLPSQIMDHLLSGVLGAIDPGELNRIRSANAERTKYLATVGLQNPMLLSTSPSLVKAIDQMLGAGTAQEVLSTRDPNVQARYLAQAYGVPLLPTGNEFEQLVNAERTQGWGVTVTSKGEIRFNKQARPTSEQDKLQAFRDYQTVFESLLAAGQDEISAAQNAARRVQQVGAARGYILPQSLEDLAMAAPETALAAAQAASKEFAQQQVQLQFAGRKAAAAEAGTRAARINQPITPDEIRVGYQVAAEEVGGVAYGRTMSDDDLQAADEQGLALKQQPDGSYIGIPQDRLRADPAVMYPRELLTKRTAQKIAAKKTTQHENAQIVLERLDEIDHRNALGLLQPATQQAPGLIPGLVGALKTEAAGQTVGRITLFNARRSTDPAQRDRAVALLSLKTLTTSVVKALGDVGAISEADKAVISDRFNRIANGVASQEEAASELQLLRTMMTHVTAGPKDIRPNSPEAAAMKETIHKIRTGQIPPGSPPEGFRILPGTNIPIRISDTPLSQ